MHGERELGLPSLNDSSSLYDWTCRAGMQATTPRTPVRMVLAGDTTGYHAEVYSRLREHDGAETKFERRLLSVIRDSARKQTPAVHPPHLRLSDADLCIDAPSRGKPLEVEIDTQTIRLNPGQSRVLFPPWPRQIRWRARDEDDSWTSLRLFADPTNILVFDGETGRQTDTLNPHDGDQRVPGGSIVLVSMQPFRANGEPAYSLGQTAYVLFCDVAAALHIAQGDSSFVVKVHPRPRLSVGGARVARRSDGWLLAAPEHVVLRGGFVGADDQMEIRVDHPSMGEAARTPVQRTSDGSLAAPLDLPKRGPFGMATVSVHIKHQNRSLHRSRFWYWPSLKGFSGSIFDAVVIPENLAVRHLAYIGDDGEGRLALHSEPPYLRARLAFDVDRRLVSFDFPPPGVSMLTRTSAGKESPLGIGARLPIGSEEYASHLVVRCTQPGVSIDLRGAIINRPFDKFGLCRIPFARLASGGDHSAVRLLPHDDAEKPRTLVRIESERDTERVSPPVMRTDSSRRGPIRKHAKLVKRRHGRGRRRRRAP